MVSRGRTGAPKRMTHFRYTFKKILVVHRNEWNQMWLSSGKGQRGKLGKWLRKTICAHTKTLHQHGLCTLLTTVCPFVWIQPPSPMYASRYLPAWKTELLTPLCCFCTLLVLLSARQHCNLFTRSTEVQSCGLRTNPGSTADLMLKKGLGQIT